MARHFSRLYCQQPEYVWVPDTQRERFDAWLWQHRILYCLLRLIGYSPHV